MKFRRDRGGAFDNYYGNTYAPNLLKGLYNTIESPETREERIEIDPIAHTLTIRVANLITKNPPIFLDKQENELEDVREGWIKGDFDRIFNDSIIQCRTHGYSLTEHLKKPFAGKEFIVWKATEYRTKLDNDWNVEFYEITPRLEPGDNLMHSSLPAPRKVSDGVLHYEVGRRKRNQQGLSVLKPVWAQIVRANQILESMSAYAVRVGNGWLIITVDPKLYRNREMALVNDIKSMNQRRFLLLSEAKDFGQTKVNFIGAGNSVDFPRDLETILGYISSSSGFPIRFFIGSPKGALSASKEDKLAVYDNLKSIFGEYKTYIRQFIEMFMDNGESISDLIKEVKWDDQGVLDEIDKEMNPEETEMDKNVKYTTNEKSKEVNK